MRKVLMLVFLGFTLISVPATAEDVVSDVVAADVAADVVTSDVVAADVVALDAVVVASDVTVPMVVVEIPKQPETDEEAVETVSFIVAAANAGAWPVMVGFVIMLAVWVVRRFALKTISAKWNKATPWVVAGLGILSCVGISLSAGTLIWWRALLEGVMSGLFASGLWELIGKRVLGSVPETPLPTVGESPTE